MTNNAALEHVALAARLASAVAADDEPGWAAVLNEIRAGGLMQEVLMAQTVRHITVCREYYDTDTEAVLNGHAFAAIAQARRARGDRLDDDDDDDD